MEIGKTFCGRTDGRTHLSSNLLGHHLGDDLKIAKKSPSAHHHTTLSGYIFAIKACIDNRKKNLLSSNISCRCPHNMVNFGLVAAEIGQVVWGTPANFNGFRALAALLHGSQVVSVSQTLRR